jgi:MFS family permease
MGFISVAWLIAGVTPNFPLLVVAVVLISLPGSVWHLPAMAALSQRLPERRGLAISIHGMGGNAGNIVGPLVAGTLLLGLLLLTWRQVALVYAVPPVLIACLFWFSLRGSGRQGTDVTKGLKARLKDARGMFRHPSVRAVVLVAMLRGMGFNTVTFWMPLYLANELGMGDVLVGFHVALLTALGIPALPVMGALSDKLGRRAVLLPGHALMAILVFALVNVGPGLFLTLVIAAMGLFSYSLNQVLRAAVLDLAPKGAEATSYGLIFGSAQLFAAASPLLAGALYDWQGIQAVFYYAATVVALSALVLAIGPTPGRRAPSPARA